MKISSLFPNHHFCECDDSSAHQSKKCMPSHFFFFFLLCVAPRHFKLRPRSLARLSKLIFNQIHIANPKPQSGPPPSQELDKILDFFPCLSLCVCVLAHTYHQVVHIVDCVAPHCKSMKAMLTHIIKQALKSKSGRMAYRR